MALRSINRLHTVTRNESILIGINELFDDDKADDVDISKIANDPPPITKETFISLCLVYFSVFLDMMGVSICQPIIPFYADKFNVTATQLTALYSSYSGMSFIASFLMGNFSDKYGRKPMILFSLFGTMFGFLCTGLAQNYPQLLACRFLTGFFGATIPVAMACVTDVVPSKSKPKYLAAIGVSISMAFVIGPSIGSGLSEFSLRVPFFVSSGLGGVGFILAIFLLKESHPKCKRKQNIELNENEDGIKKKNKIAIEIWFICIVYFLVTMAWTVFQSIFGLYLIRIYNLSSLQVGYITTSKAITAVFSNLVIFAIITKYISLSLDMVIVSFLMGIALLLSPFINNLYIFLFIFIFGVGMSWGQIMPAMNAMGAEYTNIKNRGIIMAIVSSAYNMALVIGPIVHGELFQLNSKYPFYFGAGCSFIAGIIMISMIWKWPQLRFTKKQQSINKKKQEIEKEEVGGSESLLLEYLWNKEEDLDDKYQEFNSFHDFHDFHNKMHHPKKNILNVISMSYPFTMAYYVNFDKTITMMSPYDDHQSVMLNSNKLDKQIIFKDFKGNNDKLRKWNKFGDQTINIYGINE